MQSIPVYVINLDRSPDRLAHVTAQARSVGFEFERIRAVDGRAPGFAEGLGQRPAGPLRHQVVPPAVAACFQSHRLAWERIAGGDAGHGIVLEDDIVLKSGFRDVLEPSWLPPEADLVRLESWWAPLWLAAKPLARHRGRAVHRLLGPTSGTGAYLVSRAAAAALLERTAEQLDPVDVVMFDPRSEAIAGLSLFQMCPAPARQAHLSAAHQTEAFAQQSLISDDIEVGAALPRARWRRFPLPFADMPIYAQMSRGRLLWRYLVGNLKGMFIGKIYRVAAFG